MNRRGFLKGLAGAAGVSVVAGSAAAGWRSHDAGLLAPDGRPFEPWDAFASSPAGDARSLVAAAILAANPHNTQPWRFAIEADAVSIRPDTARNLGSFDPFLREMWIGLGCAVENMIQAAPAKGFAAGRPIVVGTEAQAAIRLPIRPIAPQDAPLAAAIPARRTNRAPYRSDAVEPAALETLQAAAQGFDTDLRLFPASSPPGQALARLTIDATARINADAAMGRDGHRWFRPHARAIAEHRDGVSIPTAGLSPLITTVGQLLPAADEKASGEYWLNSTRATMAATPHFGTLSVPDLDDRAGQVDAGRLWQKLHLVATALGLAVQPINQLPEMVDRERQLGQPPATAGTVAEFATAGRRITFAFRLGHPSRDVPHSARRPLDAVLAPAA